MPPMKVRLYSIPGSHPVAAVEAMLRHKGIAYKRTDLVTVMAKAILRLLGFPKNTVPAMKIDGVKVQGSRQIARELDRVRPEPPLFPADAEKRVAVEEAERWGEEELQHPVRQIVLWSIKESRTPIRSYLEGAKLGLPLGLAAAVAPPIIAVSARMNGATERTVREDLVKLGGLVQQVDDWIAAGVLDGEELNAADFQIAASLRLAMTLQDVRPSLEGRPAGELAMRAIPSYAGECTPILPAAWLEPLRGEPAPA
jgi:glutathione S-transferase